MSASDDQVFHSSGDNLRKRIHIVLVRPEHGANVGSAARALANMGIEGSLRIVSSPHVINEECLKLAKHAKERLDSVEHFSTLRNALEIQTPNLSIAVTARAGSAKRPHPLFAREAVHRSMKRLLNEDITNVFFVFGPESDGLTNDEVTLCDWIATIPSSSEYRSLNLAQAVLIFCYEVNLLLIERWYLKSSPRLSQKERLIRHIIEVSENAGFILPGDPYKMKPQLETLLGGLPNHINGISTWHGLLDQIRLNLREETVQYKGRFRKKADSSRRENELEG